jgi:hypothetical protein
MHTNIPLFTSMILLALAGCNREASTSQEQPSGADAIQDIAPASPPAPPEDGQSPDADAKDEQEAPAVQ